MFSKEFGPYSNTEKQKIFSGPQYLPLRNLKSDCIVFKVTGSSFVLFRYSPLKTLKTDAGFKLVY